MSEVINKTLDVIELSKRIRQLDERRTHLGRYVTSLGIQWSDDPLRRERQLYDYKLACQDWLKAEADYNTALVERAALETIVIEPSKIRTVRV